MATIVKHSQTQTSISALHMTRPRCEYGYIILEYAQWSQVCYVCSLVWRTLQLVLVPCGCCQTLWSFVSTEPILGLMDTLYEGIYMIGVTDEALLAETS